jgi:predicted dienelactone hydrolase
MMRRQLVAAAALAALAGPVNAAVGLTVIGRIGEGGAVAVYYPTDAESRPVTRGPFTLQVAPEGKPKRGNGRLVVVSHGSGGIPWSHTDLARVLVEDGFVVAMPVHHGDNALDPSTPGPESWKRRPLEVSRAIDALGADARFAPLLKLDKVGMFGYSAGGHAALSLAGGRWSPATFRAHCDAHIREDFQSCVGLATQLGGNMLDGFRTTLALWVIRHRFDDASWQTHTDPRIAAIVAAEPFAADFDMASLAAPRVPLALVTLGRDRWLTPKFHSEAVLKACTGCERLADLPSAGHGAFLSPAPKLSGLAGELLNDPPGFDRGALPEVDRKIAGFFHKRLLP